MRRGLASGAPVAYKPAMTEQPAKREINPLLKFALEMGPLVVFFVMNSRAGIYVGTGAFMAATVIALAVSYIMVRTIPIMPLVTAAILFFGIMTGRLFIKLVLEGAFNLTERGWRLITWAWIGFFIFLAALNEVVWRNSSTDFWVSFKVFGVMPLTILFSFAMIPVIMRHTVQPLVPPDAPGPDETIDRP